jgi:PhnB protein
VTGFYLLHWSQISENLLIMNKNAYIPEGYSAIIPALAFKGADAAIKWYKNVFNAKERMRFDNPDGTIAHAEIEIDNNVVMLSEENLQFNSSPKTLNGNSVNLCVYVPDVDATIKKAVDNKAKLIKPAEDQFYGDRSGRIEDPFGYLWIIATHVKDVSAEEMKKAMSEMAQEHA